MTFTMGLGTLTLLLMTSAVLGAPATSYNFQSLGRSSELFAANLYQQLAKESGNVLISPASLQTVLALVQMAANDQTLNEMSRTLSLPIDKPTVQRAFRELLPYLRGVKHSILNSANKIYIKDGFDLSPNYTQIAVDSFDAEIETKNFNDKEKTVDDINEWVESKTNSKIQELIKADMIDHTTQMILVNALYFNGEWEVPFDSDFTRKRNFYTNATHSQKVEMMVTERSCNFNEDNELDAKFLELPYAGEEFTMTFILPNKRDGLPALEAKLPKVLQRQQMEQRDVVISIPKFKIEQATNYNDVLQHLGMIEAFREDADFTDFSVSKRDLHISNVIQKTFIDVNEKGTEAAAASASFVVDRIFGGSTFIADHPFIFVLRHTTTGTVEFIGRYAYPEVEEEFETMEKFGNKNEEKEETKEEDKKDENKEDDNKKEVEKEESKKEDKEDKKKEEEPKKEIEKEESKKEDKEDTKKEEESKKEIEKEEAKKEDKEESKKEDKEDKKKEVKIEDNKKEGDSENKKEVNDEPKKVENEETKKEDKDVQKDVKKEVKEGVKEEVKKGAKEEVTEKPKEEPKHKTEEVEKLESVTETKHDTKVENHKQGKLYVS